LTRFRDGKKIIIGVYSSSNTPGRTIRDAMTGTYCGPHKVGSLHEHLYFKTKIAMGEVGRDSVSFFFDNPEQYERPMLIDLPVDIKEAWHNKFLQIKARLDA
jgi:hypothetical protein